MADTKDRIIRENDLPGLVFGKIVRSLDFDFRQSGSGLDFPARVEAHFTGFPVAEALHPVMFYRKTNSFRHQLGKMTNAQLEALGKVPGTERYLLKVGSDELLGRSTATTPVTDDQICAQVGEDVSRLEGLIKRLQEQRKALESEQVPA